MEKIELTLPCPPSINAYHRHSAFVKNGKAKAVRYTTKEGKQFVERVKDTVIACGAPSFGAAEVAVLIDVHLPSNRGDHHNREKPMLDALEHAGVYDNDKQVIDLRVRKRPPVYGGRCHVTIWRV